MNLRSAAAFAVVAIAISAGPTGAQAPWPDQPQQPAMAPWPQAQPRPQATGPAPWSQEPPPCVKSFFKLRDVAAKHASSIQAAEKRKASPQEACGLFKTFYAAEAKLLKYAVDNTATCGIPAEVVSQLKQSHARTNEIRIKVCQVAAAPPRPVGPTLSDALGAPVTDSNNIKTGGGTFDTLTGTPLGNR